MGQRMTNRPGKGYRFLLHRYRYITLSLFLILALTFTMLIALVTSGSLPHILYNGKTVSLGDLNAIRSQGGATFCVQQVNTFSHFIGMSFEYACFDSEAEANQNRRQVQAQLQTLESP